MDETSTHKQLHLGRVLFARGYHRGWRRFLLEHGEYSLAQLSNLIFEKTGIAVDPSTLADWKRQAKSEGESREGEGLSVLRS